MSNTNVPAKQRSATERLNDVEQATMSVFQALDNMSRDLMLIKDAIKLLANKVDSIVKASASGQPLNDEVISAIMVQNNVDELKSKVDGLIAQNILFSEEAISAQSFVVIREVDSTGKVVNPRLQFTMGALDPSVTEKLLGAKVGQTVNVKEGTLDVEVLEIYGIKSDKPETAPAAEAPAAEAANA